MSEKIENVFAELNDIDVSGKTKEKGGFTYLSWASAWSEVKKRFPDATYKIYPMVIDDRGNERFWHDDGKSGWVEVGVTINGIEMRENLAIMDFRNKAIPAENITSFEANKSAKRCLVKACALHGLALYIYEGEDIPEASAKVKELIDQIDAVAKKKVALSDKAKEKVATLCKDAERKAKPDLDEDLISGNYKDIEDADILTELHKKLLAVRK